MREQAVNDLYMECYLIIIHAWCNLILNNSIWSGGLATISTHIACNGFNNNFNEHADVDINVFSTSKNMRFLVTQKMWWKVIFDGLIVTNKTPVVWTNNIYWYVHNDFQISSPKLFNFLHITRYINKN